MKTKHPANSVKEGRIKIVDRPLERRNGHSGLLRSKYPFSQVKIGQMMFIPKVSIKNISPLASIASKKLNRLFKCRTTKEDNILGVGVYRVRGHKTELAAA